VIIDFHTHIFSPSVIANRDRYAVDPCFKLLYSSPKARLVNAEGLITEMDSSGVDKAIILNIGWKTHEFCVETNDYLLESASKYSERLIPFVAVQPTAGHIALREIERCAAAGARGIGEFRPDVQDFDVNDAKITTPVAEILIENDLVFLCHADEPVGHVYPGKGRMTPEVLYPFIASNPGLKVVLAHWGGGLPFYTLMPEAGEALRNVWYDSAASPYLYRPKIYETVAGLSGVDKVLFGSDWPLLGQKRCLDEVKGLGLAPTVTDKILGGNAAALLGIGLD